jgi:DNA-binding NarL/FixJ family response regulator
MSIKILVVDDQELVRAGFVVILDHQEDLKVVGEAGNGAEACELARILRPDVILMDIRMPKMDGIEATRRITDPASDVDARVLVLTTFGDDESVFESLRAGASGFLLKDVPPAELVQAIRVVAAGESLLAPRVTRGIIERFVAARPGDVELQRRVALLSEREQEVLKVVGQGLTNADIAERLFVSEATVKSHVSHILAKLGAKDRAQAVAIAYEAGLIQIGSLEP